MSLAFNDIPRLMGQTLRDPSGVARFLMSEHLPRGVVLISLFLVSILGVFAIEATFGLSGAPRPEGPATMPPFVFVGLSVAFTFGFAWILAWTGRIIGGEGQWTEMLLMLVWFQLMAVGFQLIQALTLMTIPGLIGVVSIIGLSLMFYLILTFIDVVHGYGNLLKAFGTLILGVVALALGFGIIASALGISP